MKNRVIFTIEANLSFIENISPFNIEGIQGLDIHGFFPLKKQQKNQQINSKKKDKFEEKVLINIPENLNWFMNCSLGKKQSKDERKFL